MVLCELNKYIGICGQLHRIVICVEKVEKVEKVKCSFVGREDVAEWYIVLATTNKGIVLFSLLESTPKLTQPVNAETGLDTSVRVGGEKTAPAPETKPNQ